MAMLLDYKKLWEEGGYSKDNLLDQSLKFIESEATKRNIPKEIMEMAIMEIFFTIADGYQYSLTECACGCGIDKSGTAVIHAILQRMLEIEHARIRELSELVENRINTRIIGHMELENKKYVDEKMPIRPGMFRRVWDYLWEPDEWTSSQY